MNNPLPKADVVVIGLGAGGSIASHVLTQAGISVVAIEAGPFRNTRDYTKHLDELSSDGHRNWLGAPKFNNEMPTWRPNAQSKTQDYPSGRLPMANGVGGSTVHFTGMGWRFRQDDFKIRSTTIDAYGEDAIPEGADLADWPLDYDDVEPYYHKVEEFIGVAGVGGANPFESPRAHDYPMPPLRRSGYNELIDLAMRKEGHSPFPIPAMINSQDRQGRPACTYCGFCTSYGCWNNSKSAMDVTAVPVAQATGKLEIRANSRVTTILSNDKGEVTGVRYVDDQGQEQEQPAGVVILSAYIYENIRLLLLSSSDAYPDGLVNKHGQVGRNFMTHTFLTSYGLFDGHRLNIDSGTSAQGTAMDDLNGNNFDHSGLGFIRGGVTTTGEELLPIAMSRQVPPDMPQWGPKYKQFLKENAQSIGTVMTQLEVLPYEANFTDLDPHKKDPYGIPLLRLTYDIYDNEKAAAQYILPKQRDILESAGATKTWSDDATPMPIQNHAYGGARMGDDPAASVVNKYSQAHEAPNLFILGGATYPSTAGYNPTLTLFSLAWMAADYLADNFQSIAI